MSEQDRIDEIGRLDPLLFELLVHDILTTNDPSIRKLRSPDGGCDSIHVDAKHGWQAKRFSGGRISWAQCLGSIKSAEDNFEITEYTFVFSAPLTGPQLKSFQKRIVLPWRKKSVSVDYLDATWIASELRRTEMANIEDRYFGENVAPSMIRAFITAIRGAEPLATELNTVERSFALRQYLSRHDALFDYAITVGREAGPPTPGAIVRMELGDETGSVVIDAISRVDDLPYELTPRLSFSFDDSDIGMLNSKRMERVVRLGGRLTLEEGFKVEHSGMPSLMDAIERERAEPDGRHRFLIQVMPKLEASTFRVTFEDSSEAPIEIHMSPTAPGPEWDAALHGVALQGCLELRFNIAGPHDDVGPSVGVELSYKQLRATTSAHLEATKAMSAFANGSRLRISEVVSGDVVLDEEAEGDAKLAEIVSEILRVHLAIETIERRAGVQLGWPPEATDDEINHVLRVAHIIETHECPYTFRSVDLVGNGRRYSEIKSPESGAVVLEHPLIESVFGVDLDLGTMRVPLGDCAIVERAKRGPKGRVELRLTPDDSPERTVTALLLDSGPLPAGPQSLSKAA